MTGRWAIGPVLIAAAAVGAGCADLRWQKEGATAAVLEQDLADCQGQARVRSAQFIAPLGGDLPRMLGLDGRGRPVMPAMTRPESDRFLVEHDLTRSCMNARGYDLVPVEKK